MSIFYRLLVQNYVMNITILFLKKYIRLHNNIIRWYIFSVFKDS